MGERVGVERGSPSEEFGRIGKQSHGNEVAGASSDGT